MKKMLVLCTLLTVPCHAGKGMKVDIDVQEELNYRKLCDQSSVLARFPNVLKEEGLSHLISEEEMQSKFHTDKKNDDLIVDDDGNMTHSIIIDMDGYYEQFQNSPFTSEDLNRSLVEDFLGKRKSAMRESLATGCSPVLCNIGYTTLTYYLGCLGELAGGMQLVKSFAGVQELSRESIKGGRMILDPDRDPLFKYEVAYVKTKRFFPTSLQESLENMFYAARQSDRAFTDSLDNLPKILRLPVHSKSPNPNVKHDLFKLTSGYLTKTGSLSDALLNFCTGHYARYMKKSGPNPAPNQIVCLQGDAGIGKTYIAEYTAQALGVPFYKVSLSGGAQKFFGDSKNPGVLLETLMSAGNPYLNGLIFFDEGDHTLNCSDKEMTDWLQFFDPESKQIYFPYLRASLDKSHFFLMLAINSQLKNEALKNRMDIIEITGLEKSFKKSILINQVLPKLLVSENPTMNLKMQDLGLEDSNIDSILDKDQDPGFRSLKRLFEKQINAKRALRLDYQ